MRELRKTVVDESPIADSQHTIQQDTEQRRRKRLIRRVVLFLGCAFAVVLASVVTFYKQEAQLEQKRAEAQRMQEDLESLQAEAKLLKEEIVKLNDDEYIAKIARRDYFFSKKGETIYPIAE